MVVFRASRKNNVVENWPLRLRLNSKYVLVMFFCNNFPVQNPLNNWTYDVFLKDNNVYIFNKYLKKIAEKNIAL